MTATDRASKRQRGSAAVEAALILPVMIVMALMAADLYHVAQVRADLERRANTLSSVLAAQDRLTSDGIDRLVEAAFSGPPDNYEIFVGQVGRDGRVAWTLPLGNAVDLCDNPLAVEVYEDSLPEREDPEEDENEDDGGDGSGDRAMMMVQVCRDAASLGLSSLTLNKDTLLVRAVNRMRSADPDLDEDLRRRAGLPREDEEAGSGEGQRT